MRSYGLMSLQREKEKITRIIFDIGFDYLHDSTLRSNFMTGERKAVDEIINQYSHGKIDFSQAMKKLHERYQNLHKSYSHLQMNNIKLYAITEQEKQRHSLLTITLKRVGFISGSMQVIGGAGLCKASIGTACKSYGIPLIIQGSENAWENGYYLVYHEDPKQVPLRHAYRQVANFFGGDNKDGDIAFATGDLALSVGSASTLALKSDSWKLFHYIKEDFIRNWRTLGAVGAGAEFTGNAASGFSIYQLTGGESTNWDGLGK